MNQHVRDAQFQKHCRAGQDLFHEKNTLYGDAIRFMGLVGAVSEIMGCAMRLIPMVYHDPKFGASNRDKIVDILTDLHNYSVIALMMLEDNNFNGFIWEEEKKE